MNRSAAATILTGWLWLMWMPAWAEEVVDQREYSDSNNACGPASVLNCLKFSRPELRGIYDELLGSNDGVKMRFVVDRYLRSRRSVVYPGQMRWGVHGVATADLVTAMNELMQDHDLPELSGSYLDRAEGEPSREFVRRIHETIKRSIDRGVSPILSLRAFLVRDQEEQAGQPAWEAGPHHNVVITGVGDFQKDTGFLVNALDPWEGRRITIFLYREGAQSFRALKGVEPSGTWLDGRSFLVAAAPEAVTLIPRNLEWHERYLIVANFLIGDF